jgi:hypothetical protein
MADATEASGSTAARTAQDNEATHLSVSAPT